MLIIKFNKNEYNIEELVLNGEQLRFRAFRNIVYVDKTVDETYQSMHIFAPEIYFEGGSIGGYNIDTAPVFMPNTVGGYMPGPLDEPGYSRYKPQEINSIFRALQHGYVVAAPALRGRVLKDENGKYYGKAPACLIDYKAAVRFLHYFADNLPGDQEKIITNGTSAGGALSSLMGATGDHEDYAIYLKEIGAADASDAVFAASCYCPITDLDHADMAYEWQFAGIYDYHRMNMKMEEGGRPQFTPEDGCMNEEQIQNSCELKALFPEYINSLRLVDVNGKALTLDEDGNGSFKDYMSDIIMTSAEKAIKSGSDITNKNWLEVADDKVAAMDFAAYARDITRMKTAPAFDDVMQNSPENDLFGTEDKNCLHFTKYSAEQSRGNGEKADEEIIRRMNPTRYIRDVNSRVTKYWRIRHGECDRDTSLAVSAILAAMLKEQGCEVDYHSPWEIPHSGDYDLEELFEWIDEICK